jgi:hypothetical protein
MNTHVNKTIKIIVIFVSALIFTVGNYLNGEGMWNLKLAVSLGDQNGIRTTSRIENIPLLLGDAYDQSIPENASMHLYNYTQAEDSRTRMFGVHLKDHLWSVDFSWERMTVSKFYSRNPRVVGVSQAESWEISGSYKFSNHTDVGISYSYTEYLMKRYLHHKSHLFGISLAYDFERGVAGLFSIEGNASLTGYPFIYSTFIFKSRPEQANQFLPPGVETIDKQGLGVAFEQTIYLHYNKLPVSPFISYRIRNIQSKSARYSETTQILILGLTLDLDIRLSR